MKTDLLALIILMSVFNTAHASVDPLILLKNNNITELDSYLISAQKEFENGAMTETELRNTYRPFYVLDKQLEQNLVAWVKNSPKSYVAHLALGIYYKKKGQEIRGEEYISKTPIMNITVMHHYFDLANKELNDSLSLTTKPFLSIFHLLDIAINLGNRKLSEELLSKGYKIFPENSLIRLRYATSLLPRWGGSYAEFDAFIMSNKIQKASSLLLQQLEAIKRGDIGLTLEEQKDYKSARIEYVNALQLGSQGDNSFNKDFLKSATNSICTNSPKLSYCP